MRLVRFAGELLKIFIKRGKQLLRIAACSISQR
jgi:hypothetical protein